jgi:hypothetical protein
MIEQLAVRVVRDAIGEPDAGAERPRGIAATASATTATASRLMTSRSRRRFGVSPISRCWRIVINRLILLPGTFRSGDPENLAVDLLGVERS